MNNILFWWELKSVQFLPSKEFAIFHPQKFLDLPKNHLFWFPPAHHFIDLKQNKKNPVLSLLPALFPKLQGGKQAKTWGMNVFYSLSWIPHFKSWFCICKFTSTKRSCSLNKTLFCTCRSYHGVSAALGANEKLSKKTGSPKCKDYGCLCKFPQNKTNLCTL